MLRSTAVSRIQRGLGFRTDLEDECISALQEAQREFERARTLPWFLVEEDQTLSVTSGTQTVALPDGFLMEVEDDGLHYTSTDAGLVYLTKRPFDEAKLYYRDTDAGEPLSYSLRKASLYVFPEPDTNYTLTWSYFKAADVLTSDVENAWLENVPELLIAKAGLILAMDLENADSTKKFAAMFETWNNWLVREIARRESEAMPRRMGANH